MLTTVLTNQEILRKKRIRKLLKDPEFKKWAQQNHLFEQEDTENEDYWCGVIHQDMEEFYS